MGRKKKDSPPTPPQNPEGGRKRRGRPIPFWQLALLGVSVLLMLGGGAAWGYSKFMDKPPAPVAGVESGVPVGPSSFRPDSLASGFGPGTGRGAGSGSSIPGATAAPASEQQEALDLYSPAVFRLGFSFFAAFAMAYALRQFVKITLVVVGAALIGLFALQYAGLVSIDWSLIEGKFDSVAAFMRSQTESFTKFVSGYLPSATSAAAGAFIGFRKK